MKRLLFAAIMLALLNAHAQTPINGYARVTSIAGAVLSLSNVNETYDSFEAGEQVIVFQVQDNTIGTTTNSANFGDVGSIQSAGLYETKVIQTINESGGVPTSITLATPLVNTYNSCTNCRIQVVTYPTLGSGGNFTTTGDISTLNWNGNVGGVIAFKVTDTLFLEHNISANSSGFRGGGINPTNLGGTCQPATFITNSNSYAAKGEGVFRNTDANFTYARGRMLNGGGGGNPHNSGGGGGGNFTAGGNGGPGWNCGGNDANGLGGIDLSDYIAGDRLFMGGGGGGGQGNNSVSTPGANGGGIIMINAGTISTNSCAGFTISANGASAAQAGNDGGGGAGAGGSVLINVGRWDLNCSLTVSANGGTGGSVNSGNIHGGGGGGGKGVLVFGSAIGGVPNLNTNNTQGSGGANQTGGSPSVADDGVSNPSNPSADSDGVVETEDNPLPVTLLYWKGSYKDGKTYLEWSTASEINNDFFTIERSYDGRLWTSIAEVSGSGTTSSVNDYWIEDNPGKHGVYYRLTQTDFDGTTETFEVIYIMSVLEEINLVLFPNPTEKGFQVSLPNEFISYELEVLDLNGRRMSVNVVRDEAGLFVDVSSFPEGTYLVRVSLEGVSRTYQLIKKD